MSTVAEITEALPSLKTEELRIVERALLAIYRQRNTGIIYDDAYGIWTEENQTAAAAESFALMERAEEETKHPRTQT
jgi:hypothetical protein